MTLIASWDFNEGSGPTAADSSGNGYTATLQTGATWSSPGHDGTGSALDISAGYATAWLPGSDPADSAFSVELYFKSAGSTNLGWLASRGTGANAGEWYLQIYDNNFYIGAGPGYNQSGPGTTNVSSDALWHHLILSFDGSDTLTLTLNGATELTVTGLTGFVQAALPLQIGRRSDYPGYWFNGAIDSLSLSYTPLTLQIAGNLPFTCPLIGA